MWSMQERFVLLEGVPAGGLGAAQGCLHSAIGARRPAPSVRGTAQSGMGTAVKGGGPRHAECRTLSATGSRPYRGKRLPRSADMSNSFSSASTGFTRLRRSAPGRKNGGFGESRCARAAVVDAVFVG